MADAIQLLIVGNSPADATHIVEALETGGMHPAWTRVETVDAVGAAMALHRWDAVLSDHLEPSFSAAAALKLVRELDPDVPFIVVPGAVAENVGVAMMRAGANDYVLGHDLARLPLALARELEEAENRRRRRTAEQTARRFEAIVSDATYAVMSRSVDGILTSWNAGAERLYGYTAAEAIGRNINFLLSADGPDDQSALHDQILRGESVPPYDALRVHKDGHSVDVSLSISPVRGPGGAIVGISHIAKDISVRKRAEREVTQLRAIVEMSPDFIGVCDDDGHVTFLNRAGQRMAGLADSDAAAATTVRDYFDPAEDLRMAEALIPALRERGLASGDVMIRSLRDGTTTPVELHVCAISPVAPGDARHVACVGRDLTRRRESEAALRRSEARHREMVETIPHLVWTATADGHIDYVNKRGLIQLGHDPTNGDKDSWMFALHPHDAESARNHWDACVESGEPYRAEVRLRHQDGSYRWNVNHALPLRGPDGAVQRWIGTSTDVEDRHVTDAQLARAAELLKAVSDGTLDAVSVKDRAGRYRLLNPAAERFLGRTEAEVLGRDDTTWFEPDEARLVMERDRAVIVSGVSETLEESLTVSGVQHIVLSTKSAYRDVARNIVGVLGISRDITERKAAEAALRLRDRAIRAATQGLLITDATIPWNPIVYASPSVEAITGYTPEEMLGRSCAMLRGPDTDEASTERIRLAIQTARPCTVELLNYRKDGTSFWNELSLSPIRDVDGTLTHFVGVQADVTARRNLEEQFRHAQKMEAVGQLAGGVAHDFNNLLTVINGYSGLVLQSLKLDDPVRELVVEIQQAGELSAGLTRQLLAFSRKQVVRPRALNLNATIVDTEKMLRRLLRADVKLVTRLDVALWPITADDGQLEQVLMNLAVNARDAMPDGGTLTVETSNALRDDDRAGESPSGRRAAEVVLRISDTGVGMSPLVISHIFEPFYTTKAAGHGTGLGLATVYSIVEQNGGRILVTSELGVGTSFELRFPRADLPTHAAPARADDATLRVGTETVLLVEDEDAVRALVQRVLTACGYRVLVAADGAEAIDMASTCPVDIHLLLTDVVMPGAGGRDVSERVRTLKPGVRVLFMSGYTDDAVVRRGAAMDSVNFLQKPFTPSALANKVREILDAPT